MIMIMKIIKVFECYTAFAKSNKHQHRHWFQKRHLHTIINKLANNPWRKDGIIKNWIFFFSKDKVHFIVMYVLVFVNDYYAKVCADLDLIVWVEIIEPFTKEVIEQHFFMCFIIFIWKAQSIAERALKYFHSHAKNKYNEKNRK